MLYFNFKRVMRARGIDKPYRFLKDAGFSINFATKVANNRHSSLNLKYVEKLCVLFNCSPNDLLEWVPSEKETNIENHPLNIIKRTTKAVELSKMLSSIPLDKLDDIEKIIKKECDKKDE